MGRKDKNKKKGQGAEKTSMKTDKKLVAKQKKLLAKLGEEDIENIVAKYETKDTKSSDLTEIVCPPPTARVNVGICAHPADREEIFIHGGEFFNGQQTVIYGDFYSYNVAKNEWKTLKSSICPAPRSGHQMVPVATDGGQIWLFGGEYASPSQLQFYHFRDLWVYRMAKKQWEKINAPNGPSARSGHRMVVTRKKLFVFGGFHDNNASYRYFNDLYAFSLESYTWTKIEGAGPVPPPRSGCCMVANADGKILIWGGYSKTSVKKEIDRGTTHTDMFALVPDKQQDGKTGAATAQPTYKWTSVKPNGKKPAPRSGMAVAIAPNGKAYTFGGVMDTEEDEEDVRGMFSNELHALDTGACTWRKLELAAKAKKSKPADVEMNEEEKEKQQQQAAKIVSDDGVFTMTVGGSGASGMSGNSSMSTSSSSSSSSGVSSMSGSGGSGSVSNSSGSGIGGSGIAGSVGGSGSSKTSSGSSGGTGGGGSSGSSSKEKDKYSKSRDKSSKSSKSSSSSSTSGGSGSNFNNSTSTSSSAGGSSNQSKDVDMGGTAGSSSGSMGALGANASSQSSSQSGYSSTAGGGGSGPGGSSSSSSGSSSNSSSKHHSDKPDKGSGGGGSSSQGGGPLSTNSGVGSGRAASLSPAAIPTTLIIKPPQDHTGGSGKEPLSKEAIAKMSTSSNFTETIVVNSESVYNHAGSGSGNAGSTSVIESGKLAMGGSGAGSGGSGGSYGGSTGPTGGSSTGSSSSSSSGGKKRKADARSTPTSSVSSSEMLDANRDLIRDVAVSLVPLSLSKNEHIDPSSIASHEKSVKKAKTETSSPLPHPATALPAPEPNLQNVTPNLIQSAHTSSIISSASSSSASSSSSSGKHQQQQQHHHHQNASANRSSPVIQQQSTAQNIIQSSSSSSSTAGSSSSSTVGPSIGHHHLERQSPSMRSSPAGVTTGGANVITSLHHSQSQQPDLLSPAGGGATVLQSVSPVPMSTIQRTSSPSTLHAGDNSSSSGGGGGGLKFGYEKQAPTTNARIAALQEEEASTGRRSRTPEMIVSSGGVVPYSMSSTMTAASSSSYGGSSGGGGGGLKFSYEAQPTNPLAAVSTASMMGSSGSVIAAPQVKDSPPSSPGSDAGGSAAGTAIVSGRGTKRNRKMSSNAAAVNSGAGAVPTTSVAGQTGGPSIVPASIVAGGSADAKDGKLFQNGGSSSAAAGGSVVSATHMLGNQLNPSSSVAQKMSDQLSMEIEAHAYVPGPIDAVPTLMGPQFPGKNRTNNSQSMPVGAGGGGNSLSSMLTGGATATANGNTPQSLEQLLERQWEQGSQFLMEQAQHFDIASLLSCLHQLRSENIRLEEHVNNLVARRDHLLAVNARLAIPLNPTAALGGVGMIGGSGGSGPGAGGAATGGAGVGGAGIGSLPGQFNNIHGNGPIDANVITNASAVSNRSSRGQHGPNQQQQPGQQGPAGHFGSGAGSNAAGGGIGSLPQENGIDFRHTNSSHPATNSASISEKPNTIYVNF